ncbi:MULTISPECIES: flagellar basal-body MS-ring/collar protein FliF [unclassified Caballeronia]|uniref:flagellar basal-body MS-ring/collar protein FliF n=1 Tax=unclassified Caballeronia TaxID=2646786 RepID=UPI002861AF0E|nr:MULTISPECIES: flagellar basal-body MS-ring/collar protein FliF [unclassified Caballeronia]MDR5774157.1 flagellar basal-body MS-ring/collar protein FliF [Caballeronia sp. LZ002]MDR5849592.1 flagellar basal-body MS-ring/collar protein FliF [Caballeronia sp. LZ003]
MNSTSSRLLERFTDASFMRRCAFVAGLLLIIAFVALSAWLLVRPSYEVMFSDLKRQDAAVIATELEKQKIPFRYDEEHAAILVPSGDTRATRLKLMSRDLRLQGVVGLELFNNSDLGLTEFAQKVNYQRALQGELARTIMTLDEIDLARVHITLPESSVFHRDNARPKASVALFMRDGQTLGVNAIRGIQRLVAAAVPELTPADVSILDASGAPASASSSEVDDPALLLKQAIEQNYERKIAALIAAVTGPGHVSVSVEASINTDQVRSTHESTISRPGSSDSSSNVPLPSSRAMPDAGKPPLPAPQSPALREDARTVHETEQIVRTPGAVRRLSVGIVYDRALPQEQMQRLTSVISTAIGLDASRGDVLSTFVRDAQVGASTTDQDIRTLQNAKQAESIQPEEAAASASVHASQPGWLNASLGLPAVAMTLVLLGALLIHARSRVNASNRSKRLTASERDRHVARLRQLLAVEESTHE